MSSFCAIESDIEGPNEDEDCEVVYNTAEVSTESSEVLPKVTEHLAKEGLEIIKEVPSPIVSRMRLRATQKDSETSKYIETISSDECPSANEDSKDSDVEWVPSPEIKKSPKKITKRSRKATKSEGNDDESSPPKKPKIKKPRASPKKKAAKSSQKDLVILEEKAKILEEGIKSLPKEIPEEGTKSLLKEIPEEGTKSLLKEIPVVPADEIKPVVPEQKVYVNEHGLLCEEFMVPSQAVGRIIGKKGIVIKRIQCDSGARVIIRNAKNGGSHQFCIISGTQAQIWVARAAVDDIVNKVMPPRNSPHKADKADKADIEIVKELRSSFVQTNFEDEEGVQNFRMGVKHTFASNNISSPSGDISAGEPAGEQPPSKKPKLDTEAGPINGNANLPPKTNKSPSAKKPTKSVSNSKGKGRKQTKKVKTLSHKKTKKQKFLKKKYWHITGKKNQLWKSQKKVQKLRGMNVEKGNQALQCSEDISMSTANTPKIKKESDSSKSLNTETDDKCSVFATSVAFELKKIKNESDLHVAKFKINEILSLATAGKLLN